MRQYLSIMTLKISNSHNIYQFEKFLEVNFTVIINQILQFIKTKQIFSFSFWIFLTYYCDSAALAPTILRPRADTQGRLRGGAGGVAPFRLPCTC